jgi:hypothetical protein
MLVDYVRVYEAGTVMAPSMAADPIRHMSDDTASTTLTLTRGVNRVYLDASVADFPGGDTQSARITFKAKADSRAGLPAGTYSLAVTAYTVSGDQSTIEVPVVVE